MTASSVMKSHEKPAGSKMTTEWQTYSLFGVEYAYVDYNKAVGIIIEHAINRQSFAVSALAVHGLTLAARNAEFKDLVKTIDLVVPDGQPVRWAINNLYNIDMKERVYGPALTLAVLERASELRLRVFLYGSTVNTLKLLQERIRKQFPGVVICGEHIDRFRDATTEEDLADIRRINESVAHIVLVGRGCPRQERWVAHHRGKVQAVMMAVGAAFDFIAGTVKQAPVWMQRSGLEWFFRLVQEPRRLWKRYLISNSYFIYVFLKYKIRKQS